MADEEPVDPKEFIENECARKECTKLFNRFVRCTERVNSAEETEETCTQELFEVSPCVDNCVARQLFARLK